MSMSAPWVTGAVPVVIKGGTALPLRLNRYLRFWPLLLATFPLARPARHFPLATCYLLLATCYLLLASCFFPLATRISYLVSRISYLVSGISSLILALFPLFVVMPQAKDDEGFSVGGVADDVFSEHGVANNAGGWRQLNGAAHFRKQAEIVNAGQKLGGNASSSKGLCCGDKFAQTEQICDRVF